MKGIILKLISISIGLFSFWLMYIGDFEDFYIVIGTIVLIAGVTMYIMSDPKTYNSSVSSTKQIANTRKLTVQDFYEAFKNQETILGKPWLGKIKGIRNKSLIFGPSENGDFLYLHKMFGSFYLAYNPASFWISDLKERADSIEKKEVNIFSDEDIICYSLLSQSAIEDIFNVLNIFSNTGEVTSFFDDRDLGEIYRFNEDFKLTGQKFTLTDYEGNPIYEINSTIPLKTFYMNDMSTGEEVFKMTKRLLRITDHYDFYMNNEKYGTFKQKIDIMHDTFVLETSDGLLEMQSINDMLGTNYIVKLNNKVIATIAESLNLTAHNLVFDNFILHVRKKQHVPLITALAVMVARELKRDQNSSK